MLTHKKKNNEKKKPDKDTDQGVTLVAMMTLK